MDAPSERKKFERKVAPSMAPGRLLKKKLRDLERLLQNKDKLKDLPEEVVDETRKKIVEIKNQITDLGPSATAQPTISAAEKKQVNKTEAKAEHKSKNGVKFTELRRAGRKISAFKKQHPNYEASESEAKTLAGLELDLLYIKHFPKHEEYISIYPDSPLTDSEQVKTQAEIRGKIQQALANGEIKKTNSDAGSGSISGSGLGIVSSSTKAIAGDKHPISNWSDDEDSSSGNGVEDNKDSEKSEKKIKTK
ncbi:hypothetical protein BG004_004041 [Podila humilis]|nr:hypothetical protein BG004_004041 [Podila humilis]